MNSVGPIPGPQSSALQQQRQSRTNKQVWDSNRPVLFPWQVVCDTVTVTKLARLAHQSTTLSLHTVTPQSHHSHTTLSHHRLETSREPNVKGAGQGQQCHQKTDAACRTTKPQLLTCWHAAPPSTRCAGGPLGHSRLIPFGEEGGLV